MTYCLELLCAIMKGTKNDLKLTSANYTINGLTATIEDRFDEQLYQIDIKPLYKKSKEGKKTS